MKEKKSRVYEFKNNSGDKIRLKLEVTEKNGNVTFITMQSHVRRFINSFPDIRKWKEAESVRKLIKIK